MNQSGHTPGPWTSFLTGGEYWVIGGDGLNVICRFKPVSSENNMANARLIEAAPKMKELLKSAIVALEDCPFEIHGAEGLSLIEKARAILDRIEGGR